MLEYATLLAISVSNIPMSAQCIEYLRQMTSLNHLYVSAVDFFSVMYRAAIDQETPSKGVFRVAAFLGENHILGFVK